MGDTAASVGSGPVAHEHAKLVRYNSIHMRETVFNRFSPHCRNHQREHMTPETSKLVAHAEHLLSAGFSSVSTRDPNCIALLNCVHDKGNAGRLSLLPSGLSFEGEGGGGVLQVPMHDLLHVSLQETNHSDVDVPLQIPASSRNVVSDSEPQRMQRLLVECKDATRLMGGSANLSGAPDQQKAAADLPDADDAFQQLQKRVVVVQCLIFDGFARNNLVPVLSELRFVAPNPNDALEFSIIASSRVKARWAQQVLADVRKVSANSSENISMVAPVVSLNHAQSGFFGGKNTEDLIEELSLVCVCSKGVAVASLAVNLKAEHGYAIEKWRFVDYPKLSDISLSCDDPLQMAFAFAKGSSWCPAVIYASCPTVRWEICSAVQRLYCTACSGRYLAQALLAEKLYPASWGEVRALTQSSAELWLSRAGLPCLKFGRQGEPQVRIIRLNVIDFSLNWNSSDKKKEPLYLAQVCAHDAAGSSAHLGSGSKFQHRPTIASFRQVSTEVSMRYDLRN
jgi:hypothetical protein